MISSIPWASAGAATLSAFDALAVVELLEQVEQLPCGATGALVLGPRGSPFGTVLVENGRVCWAMAQGMGRRMTDLLRYQSLTPLDTAQVEEIYAKCRVSKTALGEALVESGLVSPDGLRRALRQHTAEALALLSQCRRTVAWIEHRRSKYDARFTFVAGELFVGLGALRMAPIAGSAHAVLRHGVDETGAGVAFGRSPGTAMPMPIAAVGMREVGVRTLQELGRWAMSSLDLTRVVDPKVTLVGAVTSSNHSLLIWQQDDVVYVALCEDPSDFAVGIVKQRRNQRAP